MLLRAFRSPLPRWRFLASTLVCGALLTATLQQGMGQSGQAPLSVSGRVINAMTGAPIARVLIQANGQAVFSDHEGKFQVSDTAAIDNLQITKPGFAMSPEQIDSSSFPVPTTAPEQPMEIPLWPEAILTGTVSTADSEPIARLNVMARRVLYQAGHRQVLPVRNAVTDSHGNFRLVVPAGEYVLASRYQPAGFGGALATLPVEVPARGQEGAAGVIHIGSGQELHFNLHPAQAPSFAVRVPLPGAGDRQQPPSFEVQSADGGRFSVGGPRLFAEGAVSLELPSGVFLITGRVQSAEGVQVGRTRVTVTDHPVTAPPMQMETMPSVPVEVLVDPMDTAGSQSALGTITTQIPSAMSLNLQLEPVGGSGGEMGDAGLRPQSRGRGAAAFSLAPGSYRLTGGEGSGWRIESASFGGSDLLQQNLVVGPGVGSEPIRVMVSHRMASVTGMTRVNGAPASCWVVLVNTAASLPRFAVVKSDANGVLKAANVAPGSYRALALPFFHSANYGDPAILAAFSTYVKAVTVDLTARAAIDLEAVPASELSR